MFTTVMAQFRLQTLGFARNTRSMFFTLAFPILLAALFGLANRGVMLPTTPTQGLSYEDWAVVGLTAYILLMAGFVKIAGDIAAQRESELLKRIRLRGSSDGAVLLGYVLSGLLVSWVSVALMLLVFHAFFGLGAPANLPGFILVILGGSILCSVIGVAYSSFIPSAESAQMMSLVPTLVLMFISGVFSPSWLLPESIRTIGSLFPFGYLADAARSMWFGADFVGATMQPHGLALGSAHGLAILTGGHGLVVCAIWLVAAIAVAALRFRWSKRPGK